MFCGVDEELYWLGYGTNWRMLREMERKHQAGRALQFFNFFYREALERAGALVCFIGVDI